MQFNDKEALPSDLIPDMKNYNVPGIHFFQFSPLIVFSHKIQLNFDISHTDISKTIDMSK